MEYRVVDGTDRRVDVQRLWRENLSLTGDLDARWNWLYRQSPFGAAMVLVLLAVGAAGEEVVGCCAVLPHQFRAGGQKLRAGLHVDVAVDAAHRTLRPALTLLRAARARALEQFDFVYGFPNRLTQPLFRRLRYQSFGETERWAYVLRHARYVEEAAHSARVGRVVGSLMDVVKAAGRAHGALGRRDWTSDPAALADFEDLSPADTADALVGVRNAAALRWRFGDDPDEQIRFVVAHDNVGQPAAVAAVELRDGVAHLRDLCGKPEVLGAFLAGVLADLRHDGAESVSWEFLPGEQVRQLARGAGFTRRETGLTCYVSARDGTDMSGLDPVMTAFDHDT